MEKLLRRIVRNKVFLTVAIALAGGVLVALSPRMGQGVLILGSAIMLGSPWISYGIIIVIYRRKVVNYSEDEERARPSS
ncbi:MAG: hypothetical protein ACP5HK_01250 [Acidilobus sp.]